MRYIFLQLLVLIALLMHACALHVEFVVVNKSALPVEVQYQVRESPVEPLKMVGVPRVMAASELSAVRGNEWREVSAGRYLFNRESRTIVVRVMPQEALRVAVVQDYSWGEGVLDNEALPVEEISVTGASGGLKLTGQKAQTSFAKISRGLYTLTYE
jgi:hypothetical protein